MVEVVTRRVRHRFIDYDGKVVVVNRDEPLGPGRAGKTSTSGAVGIGQMESRVKAMQGMSKMHALNAKGGSKTNPMTGEYLSGRGGWTSNDMTIIDKEKTSK